MSYYVGWIIDYREALKQQPVNGGKPKTSTPPDKRLKENKPKPATMPVKPPVKKG